MKTSKIDESLYDDIPEDYQLRSYAYALAESQIAQRPCQARGQSRLLVLDRATGETTQGAFADLPRLLPPDTLLVANNSRVLPARMYGHRRSGGRVEFLLLTPYPLLAPETRPDGTFTAEADGLLRTAKSLRQGEVVEFGPEFRLVLLAKQDYGHCRVRLEWSGSLLELIEAVGHLPLPPYIRRPDSGEDRDRYQTVYSAPAKIGSVAAPTAGLHFTPELRTALKHAGIDWAEVTLYVGYGTFSPVRTPDIRNHLMHHEYYELSPESAAKINSARAAGRTVTAIGTTSARTLEGIHQAHGCLRPCAGSTNIFIYPGYGFKAVDSLITNFHLPESSLIMMVSALAGRESVLRAYAQALESGFRFFSYGDAMLIL